MPTEAEYSAAYAKAIFSNPVRFGQSILGHTYWSKQKEIAYAVLKHTRVAVKGCNGSGKAFVAADIAMWWLSAHRDGIVITTSPADLQLTRVMWSYLHRNMKKLHAPTWTVNQKEIRVNEDNYILGFATNEPERLSGWHGKVLIIVDEAPGVPLFVYDAINGIMAAGDVHVLLLGNPTVSSGPFYDAFTKNRGSWCGITISAFDTPNLEGITPAQLKRMSDAELDNNPMPEITKRRWVRDMLNDFGEADSAWLSRVLGAFPSQSTSALYQLDWLDRAEQPAPDPDGWIDAGLDVAGPGEDETVLYLRCADTIVGMYAWGDADPRGLVTAELRKIQHRLRSVNVDVNGIGWGMARHLEDIFGSVIADVNVSWGTMDNARWSNYRAEIYWALRERLQQGNLKNLQDRETYAQASGIQYKHDGQGRIVIEKKEETKRRLGSSPDRLEALILSCITPRAAPSGGAFKVGKPRQISTARG